MIEPGRPGWAYKTANGRLLMGPCEDFACAYASKPGGERHDGAHSWEVSPPAFVSIWTDADTSEGGPTVDNQSTVVSVEAGDAGNAVLHIASDGIAGLWTVALTLDAAGVAGLVEMLTSVHEEEAAA